VPERVLPPDEAGRRLAEVFAVLGPLYRRVARTVEHDAPKDGVSIGVRAVLERLLYGGAATVPTISRDLELSRQFVQRMVNEAAADGLVEALPNPSHRRSSLIAMTPAGRARIDAVVAREHAVLRQVGGDLTDRDVERCLTVLRRMRELIDAQSAPEPD
jgi:DNA-binding MarR family transcriptional regulator